MLKYLHYIVPVSDRPNSADHFFHSLQLLFIALLASVPLDISRQIHAMKREIIVRINMAKTFHD